MNKEFCTYEQALSLKELGFDEPCFAWYVSKDFGLEIGKVIQTDLIKDAVVAPTFQQAFRFFREKHSLQHEIVYDMSDDLTNKVYVYTVFGTDRSEEYKTYEEAELECLNTLIKIVKNK